MNSSPGCLGFAVSKEMNEFYLDINLFYKFAYSDIHIHFYLLNRKSECTARAVYLRCSVLFNVEPRVEKNCLYLFSVQRSLRFGLIRITRTYTDINI